MAGIGANSLGAIQNPGSPSGRLESFPMQGTFSRQPSPERITGLDRGLWLSLRAIRRQLAAMPHDLFLIRLIHQRHQKASPRRTTLDFYSAAEPGHSQVSAYSQPRGL
jgi:hypothetical protein